MLFIANALGDEPVVAAMPGTRVPLREVIAWAMEERPDLVAEAKILSFRESPCEHGFVLKACQACMGRGTLDMGEVANDAF